MQRFGRALALVFDFFLHLSSQPVRPRLFLFGSGLNLALLCCKHDADTSPVCYSGVILGENCPDGTLIRADSQYPIGKPIVPYMGSLSEVPASDSIGSSNLIVAVNPPTYPFKRS